MAVFTGQLEPGYLGRHLGLEAEPVALQGDALDDLAAKELVADLHVGQIQVREHIGKECQALVGYQVPEVEHAVFLADEPRAEDDVGVSFDDGLKQLGVLFGLVFKVGVLDDDDIAGGMFEAGAQGAPLPWLTSWKTMVRSVFVSAISRSSSCVPSREQSSTMMICLLMGTARTRRRISWIVFFSL